MQENITFSMPTAALFLNTKHVDQDSTLRGIHFHKAIELVQVHKGELIGYIDDESYHLDCQDILLINSGVMHRLVCNRSASFTYIQIDMDKYIEQRTLWGGYLDKFITNHTSKKCLLLHGENELITIFNNIKREFEEKNFCYDEYIKAYIYTLMAFMRRNVLVSDANSFCDRRKLTELAPVIQYIDANYNTKLSLDQLAEMINSDRFRLCHMFKAATRSTLFEYINFVRIQSAEDMLIKSQKNISEIAFDCGFASIQYFNRVFKESRGYTPGVYKKSFQNMHRKE